MSRNTFIQYSIKTHQDRRKSTEARTNESARLDEAAKQTVHVVRLLLVGPNGQPGEPASEQLLGWRCARGEKMHNTSITGGAHECRARRWYAANADGGRVSRHVDGQRVQVEMEENFPNCRDGILGSVHVLLAARLIRLHHRNQPRHGFCTTSTDRIMREQPFQ